MKKKKLPLVLVILIFILFPLQAHIDISVSSAELFSRFTQSGLKPEIQLLDNSLSRGFPFNIIFSFGSTQTASSADIYKNLIISITQEDAEQIYDQLCALLIQLTQDPPPYNVKVVCGANDVSQLPKDIQRNMPAGLSTFVENLASTSNTAALVLEIDRTSQDKKRPVSITPGSNKRVAPPWLVSMCMKSFDDSSIPFTITGQLMAFYRLGLLGSNSRIEYLLSRSVAAAGISFAGDSQAQDIFSMIINLIRRYENEIEGANDTQYTILPIPFDIPGVDSRFIISERTLIFTVLATAAAGLFFLCGFSFMLGETSRQSRHDFKKTWFLIPLTAGVNFLFMFLAQQMTSSLFPSWQAAPEAAAVLKAAAAVCMMFIFSFIQYTAHFPTNVFIYGYLLTLSSFMNIFIFSVVDISLVLLFTFEYLLAFYIRTIRHTIPLITASLLMTLPFVYYAVSFMNVSPHHITLLLTDTPVGAAVLFSILIIPFQLILIRILVRFKKFGKIRQASRRRKLIEFAAAALCFACICITLIMMERTYSKKAVSAQSVVKPAVDPAHNAASEYEGAVPAVTIKGQRTELIGKSRFKCTISSPHQAVRHDVQIISDDVVPVYDASYPFDDLTKSGTAFFYLDENPPEPLVIEYTASPDKTSTVRITSYLLIGSRIEKAAAELVFKAK